MAEAFPVAQRDGILTESIDGELVVVDRRSQQAHALPALAATVWSLCDGNHSVAAIAARTGFSPDQVTDVLGQLRERDLLETAGTDKPIDRRAMLTRTAKLGGAAALTAPILTIALPAAQAAASGTEASYSISNSEYDPYDSGTYQYAVTSSADSTKSAGAVYIGKMSDPAYAPAGAPGGPPPSPAGGLIQGEVNVEIAVNSDGSLTLTLFQNNGAGSATYTAPGGMTTCELTGSSPTTTCELTGSSPMATATGFSSSPSSTPTATLVVSAT